MMTGRKGFEMNADLTRKLKLRLDSEVEVARLKAMWVFEIRDNLLNPHARDSARVAIMYARLLRNLSRRELG